MKILNTINEDYHMHSINYSDGMNTIDEIVQYASKIGLKKIIITDHSQASIDILGLAKKCWRDTLNRRENVHNDVVVLFGIEGDLLNDEGDCCFDIQGKTSDFLILSSHESSYIGDKKNLTQAYIKAINKYHDKIKCLGHLCKKGINENIDIEVVVKLANTYNIPIEFNATNFCIGRTNMDMLDSMLSLADNIYVNSDAHTFVDFTNRQKAFDYLKEKGYIS